ncbi:PD-(D/E)XK nuclease family protein [Archaeoglobus neptunius]|uniref:PD-(D/E)XK nuclease family protein n=1 Tax=Archaeoglobus neptunius TaxID=2798580 RepID=UPI0019285025|nr:PD-(D/E)XK nuclease family protein [Archaeoglobus neptunius]
MKLSRIKRRYARRIPVSRVVEQFWCEKKLEIKLVYGIREKTKSMSVGERVHRKLAMRDAFPEPENFLDWLGLQIYLSSLSTSQFLSSGIAREIFLVADVGYEREWYLTGSIDEIRLTNGETRILERKTRESRKIPESTPHKLQAMLYNRMLNLLSEQDFSKNLKAAYLIGERAMISRDFAERAGIGERRICELALKMTRLFKMLPPVSNEIDIVYEHRKSGEVFGVVNCRMDDVWVSKALKFARMFWTGEREAVKTKQEWKCRSCAVRGLCTD